MKHLAFLHLGTLVAGLSAGALALTACDPKTTDGDVDRAIAAWAEGNPAAAREALEAAAATLPESPPLNFGRGVTATATGDLDKASELLLRALEARDSALRQKVFAALGASEVRRALALESGQAAAPAAAEGEGSPSEAAMAAWEKAVDYLEDALALDPTDEGALRNLEVALVRVDPPCATRDDAREENDSAGTANTLALTGEGEGGELQDVMSFQEQLFSCPDDDDWYRIDAAPGDRFTFKLTVPEGTTGLEMRLFDAANREIGAGAEFAWDVPIDAAAAPIFLSVKNTEFAEVSYGLGVELRPACRKVEDRFESNDLPDEARAVTPGPVPDLKLCPENDDWYALILAEGESAFIYAEPADDPKAAKDEAATDKTATPEGSPLLLDVYRAFDEAGEPVIPMPDDPPLTRGGQTGRARVATLLMPGAGRYLFRVRGAGEGGFEGRYSLRVEIVPPCPEGDDRFEDNDIPEDATSFDEAAAAGAAPGEGAPGLDGVAADGGPGVMTMPGGQGGGAPPVVFARICPGDVDWWRVEDDPNEKQPAIVGLVFDHAQGDLALRLFDETGATELASSDVSTPDASGEGLVLPRDPPPDPPPDPAPAPPAAPGQDPASAEPDKLPKRPFLLEVRGKEGSENFYLLRLDRPSPSGGGDQDPNDGEDGEEGEDGQDGQPPEPDEGGEDEKEQEGQKPEPRQGPLEDALDKLDRNPENLEANENAKRSPLAGQKPLKDW